MVSDLFSAALSLWVFVDDPFPSHCLCHMMHGARRIMHCAHSHFRHITDCSQLSSYNARQGRNIRSTFSRALKFPLAHLMLHGIIPCIRKGALTRKRVVTARQRCCHRPRSGAIGRSRVCRIGAYRCFQSLFLHLPSMNDKHSLNESLPFHTVVDTLSKAGITYEAMSADQNTFHTAVTRGQCFALILAKAADSALIIPFSVL